MTENWKARCLVQSRVKHMVASAVLLKILQEKSKIGIDVEWKQWLLKGRPCEMVVLWAQKVKQLSPQWSKTEIVQKLFSPYLSPSGPGNSSKYFHEFFTTVQTPQVLVSSGKFVCLSKFYFHFSQNCLSDLVEFSLHARGIVSEFFLTKNVHGKPPKLNLY